MSERWREESEYADIRLLTVPITFKITVKGELMEARIESVRIEYVGEDEDVWTWADLKWFTIQFSDGYQDEYLVEDDEVETNKGQDKYTRALQEEICIALAGWSEKRPVYTLLWPVEGQEVNIWICRVNCYTECEYFVQFNDDYRFSVRFVDNQWITISVRIKDPYPIDEALANKVISLLKYYHGQDSM